MGAGEQLALARVEERDLAPAPALGPGGLEHEVVALVGVARLELEGLLAAQPEGGLQLETQADMRVLDLAQALIEGARLALVGHIAALGDPERGVVLGQQRGLADLLGPPAQVREAVLEGAGGEVRALPALQQRLDMTGLEAARAQVMKP